jgi:hypothetical protein
MALSKEQIGALIIAVGEETRAIFGDAQWMRRHRHGDPTFYDDLGERACLRLALPPRELKDAMKGDAKLAGLMRMTVDSTLSDLQQQSGPEQRLRKAMLIGVPLAAAVCVGAWVTYYLYQNDSRVRELAAKRAAQKAAEQAAPPPGVPAPPP